MNLIYAAARLPLALVLTLAGVTRAGSWLIERRNPPVGDFADIDGARMHYVHVPAPANADLPPIVFIHGASANLRDQMLPLQAPARRPRRDAVLRPAGLWLVRTRARQQRDPVGAGQHDRRADGPSRHRERHHRRPFLRRRDSRRLRARPSRQDARPRLHLARHPSLAGRRDRPGTTI